MPSATCSRHRAQADGLARDQLRLPLVPGQAVVGVPEGLEEHVIVEPGAVLLAECLEGRVVPRRGESPGTPGAATPT